METSIIIYHESKNIMTIMDEIEKKIVAYSTMMSVQAMVIIRKEIIVEMKDTYVLGKWLYLLQSTTLVIQWYLINSIMT